MLKTAIRKIDCMDLVLLVETLVSAGLLLYGVYLCWEISRVTSACGAAGAVC